MQDTLADSEIGATRALPLALATRAPRPLPLATRALPLATRALAKFLVIHANILVLRSVSSKVRNLKNEKFLAKFFN